MSSDVILQLATSHPHSPPPTPQNYPPQMQSEEITRDAASASFYYDAGDAQMDQHDGDTNVGEKGDLTLTEDDKESMGGGEKGDQTEDDKESMGGGEKDEEDAAGDGDDDEEETAAADEEDTDEDEEDTDEDEEEKRGTGEEDNDDDSDNDKQTSDKKVPPGRAGRTPFHPKSKAAKRKPKATTALSDGEKQWQRSQRKQKDLDDKKREKESQLREKQRIHELAREKERERIMDLEAKATEWELARKKNDERYFFCTSVPFID